MVSTEFINEVVLFPVFLKHGMNPLSSLFVLAVSPWCGYCLSDCLIYGGSSMRVLTSMCVCVNCGMTVCYNYRARERGSVVGKVLCDEGLRLRKGL